MSLCLKGRNLLPAEANTVASIMEAWSRLVRPGRNRLAGAVEIREPKGVGWCRMLPLADASAASLHAFVRDHVEPGARVITEGWQGYVHDRRSKRSAQAGGEDSGKLPG